MKEFFPPRFIWQLCCGNNVRFLKKFVPNRVDLIRAVLFRLASLLRGVSTKLSCPILYATQALCIYDHFQIFYRFKLIQTLSLTFNLTRLGYCYNFKPPFITKGKNLKFRCGCRLF